MSPVRTCERGTVLLLVPVGVLIVILLAAVTVDAAAAFLAEREAAGAAASLANDLVTMAIDEGHLRRSGHYRVSPSRLASLSQWSRRAALDRLSAVFEPDSVVVNVSTVGPTAVHVSVAGAARRVIGLPAGVNGPRLRHVEAHATGHVYLSG